MLGPCHWVFVAALVAQCDQILQALGLALFLLASAGCNSQLLQLTLNLPQLTALWWCKYMPAVAACLRSAR